MDIKKFGEYTVGRFSFLSKIFRSKLDYCELGLHDVLDDGLYRIDDVTEQDLMLKEFDRIYNHTLTSCGSNLFSHWLYTIKNREQILQLQKDMQTICSHPNFEYIKHCLNKYVGKQKHNNFVRDLWNGFSIYNFVIDNFFYLFLFNIVLNVVLSLVFTKYLAAFVVLFLVNNFLMFIATNKYISHVTSSIGYFLSICYALNKINKKSSLDLLYKTPDYKKFSRLSIFAVFFKEGIGGPSSGDIASVLIDYFRIFFAMELFSFKMVEKTILDNLEQVRDIYLYTGYIDCLINSDGIIKKYNCCLTEFNENSDTAINFLNLRNPFITDGIGQSRNLDRSIIITGLNMSGKTSFMKSVALNQIIATSFGFAFADSYSTQIVDVVSSICINDQLLEGKSRYYAEAERLMNLKETINNHKCLCVIDEILSGTNSEERIFGSTKILLDFVESDSLLIAATHDLQIAENIKDVYCPVYFDGETVGNKIEFDYVIKEGIVSKKNGLLILKLLGL
ncbi:MutS-related protein [Treponema sp.]|uniref:MutS-related protein n=1 Tax=Treponema sp. TaxID=166 RepID=UPI00298ECD05|nr:hypothetical protein [Treponema sp.]MCQ2241704.1 hypothetical protein [Treponema sp.]